MIIAEDVAHQRNPHEHKVAAERRLNHGAAALIGRLKKADQQGRDQCDGQHAAGAEQHELWPYRRGKIRRIDIEKHHAEEEHAKDHTVCMDQFLIRHQLRPLDEHTHEHQAEQRHHSANRHKEIT